MTDEPDEHDADGSAKDEAAKIVAAFRELPVGEHLMIQWIMAPRARKPEPELLYKHGCL